MSTKNEYVFAKKVHLGTLHSIFGTREQAIWEIFDTVKDCLSYGFTKMHPSVVRCWLCNLSG